MRRQKTTAQLKKDLDKVFNAYVRKRDSDSGYFQCISCQETKSTNLMHAGHFYSAGNYSAVRWDEDNVHGQCSACNTFKHGNLLAYREGLIKKIGQDRLTRLEIRRHNQFKMDRGTLELMSKQIPPPDLLEKLLQMVRYEKTKQRR